MPFYFDGVIKTGHSRRRGLVALIAVVVAVVVAVRSGAVVEDVERDVARRWAEHHQAALTQRRLAAEVTEGTLLQTAGRET